jgi:hypothetical protein
MFLRKFCRSRFYFGSAESDFIREKTGYELTPGATILRFYNYNASVEFSYIVHFSELNKMFCLCTKRARLLVELKIFTALALYLTIVELTPDFATTTLYVVED